MEIYLGHYNEMVRYEKDMDQLRALALWITRYNGNPIPSLPEPKKYVFDLIKFYSLDFAEEIFETCTISPDTISRFHSSLVSINRTLGITQEDVVKAGELQRYRNSGFWEMRRVIGQFGDIAERVIEDKVTHIVTAAVSGCIIGEYLGTVMDRKFQHLIPVSHMIFAREGPEPVSGYLPEGVSLSGNHFLIVDDAVMETHTSRVMVERIRKINPQTKISLMTVDVDPDTKQSGYLNRFANVYTFDE